jgi:GNAT superfamily N-acetyltransferase
MSAELHKAAQCYAAFVHDRPVCIAALLPRPVSSGRDKGKAIHGVSRVVTLPDYQGLGLAFVLLDSLGGMFANRGQRLNNYPAHPSFISAHDKSVNWKQVKAPGRYNCKNGAKSTRRGKMGGRPNATYSYIGPRLDIRL